MCDEIKEGDVTINGRVVARRMSDDELRAQFEAVNVKVCACCLRPQNLCAYQAHRRGRAELNIDAGLVEPFVMPKGMRLRHAWMEGALVNFLHKVKCGGLHAGLKVLMVSGSPGCGKSTLINAISEYLTGEKAKWCMNSTVRRILQYRQIVEGEPFVLLNGHWNPGAVWYEKARRLVQLSGLTTFHDRKMYSAEGIDIDISRHLVVLESFVGVPEDPDVLRRIFSVELLDWEDDSREEVSKAECGKHLMVDLETLSTRPDAVVTQIGAVFFDPVSGEAGEEFVTELCVQEQLDAGRRIDVDTLRWYQENGLKIAGLDDGDLKYPDVYAALTHFCDWVKRYAADLDELVVWCKGMDFDFPLLRSLFAGQGRRLPWKYSLQRDVRTEVAAAERRGVSIEKLEVKHDALDDCLKQIYLVRQCWAVEPPAAEVGSGPCSVFSEPTAAERAKYAAAAEVLHDYMGGELAEEELGQAYFESLAKQSGNNQVWEELSDEWKQLHIAAAKDYEANRVAV